MADPAVCSYLSKVLCSRGGCVPLSDLPQEMGLEMSELRRVLEDAGQGRFLTVRKRGNLCVLAVSAARLCVRQVCAGCDRLHLCKQNLRGRCRGHACKYSHDIFSETNRAVLKNHELFGLNKEELCVLLLQNDPFLLPDVCGGYNRVAGSCVLNDNCTRFHICRYFLKGECRFPHCKRSHNLLDPHSTSLLISDSLDEDTIWNIQAICDARIAAFMKELPSNHRPPNYMPTAEKEHPNKRPKRKSSAVKFDANNFVKVNQPDQGLPNCMPTAEKEHPNKRPKRKSSAVKFDANNFVKVNQPDQGTVEPQHTSSSTCEQLEIRAWEGASFPFASRAHIRDTSHASLTLSAKEGRQGSARLLSARSIPLDE